MDTLFVHRAVARSTKKLCERPNPIQHSCPCILSFFLPFPSVVKKNFHSWANFPIPVVKNSLFLYFPVVKIFSTHHSICTAVAKSYYITKTIFSDLKETINYAAITSRLFFIPALFTAETDLRFHYYLIIRYGAHAWSRHSINRDLRDVGI